VYLAFVHQVGFICVLTKNVSVPKIMSKHCIVFFRLHKEQMLWSGCIIPVRLIEEDVEVVDESPDLRRQLIGPDKHLLANTGNVVFNSVSSTKLPSCNFRFRRGLPLYIQPLHIYLHIWLTIKTRNIIVFQSNKCWETRWAKEHFFKIWLHYRRTFTAVYLAYKSHITKKFII